MCQECVDREDMAQAEMDGQVEKILAFYTGKMATARHPSVNVDGITDTPRGREALAEAMAGELMFRQNPAAIAFTLTVLTGRYVDLLDQWADLYVRAAEDVDVDGINLDAATTPESKLAVTRATEVKAGDDHRTGMYL